MRALAVATILLFVAACGPSTGLTATADAGTPDSGSLQTVPDSGVDAGEPDAGHDAGVDAGVDAGSDAGQPLDAGVDAGHSDDAGLDAGFDAGPPEDAGPDAGIDAGIDAGVDAGPSTVTRYPIILAHGFGVSPNSAGDEFNLALGALQDAGDTVFPDDTDEFNSTDVCGAELLTTVQQVLAQTGAQKVNIIAHSMGGLDARYVASPGGLAQGALIASITTIGTPHHGSEMADFTLAFSTLDGGSGAIAVFDAVFGVADAGAANVNACLTSLSVAEAPAFNAAPPDDPNVMYQSWAGFATIGGGSVPGIATACQNLFYLDGGPGIVIEPLESILDPLAIIVGGINDGIVAVSSATYDTFRGCIPVDHMGEAGGTVGGALAVPDPNTGYNYLDFYVGVAQDLAARGY
jgi:triacylglycerol lipase